MTLRADLYRQFGPLLTEALVLIIKNEINILRQELNLSERTNQQIMDTIQDKLNNLTEYDWMNGD